MQEHTFPLPEPQVHALDELKDEILQQRRPTPPATPWTLLFLGLAAGAVIAFVTNRVIRILKLWKR